MDVAAAACFYILETFAEATFPQISALVNGIWQSFVSPLSLESECFEKFDGWKGRKSVSVVCGIWIAFWIKHV